MAIKCINIFQSKAMKSFPKMVIFGLKTNHLATLGHRRKKLSRSSSNQSVNETSLSEKQSSLTYR
jgi:hypothetical protein